MDAAAGSSAATFPTLTRCAGQDRTVTPEDVSLMGLLGGGTAMRHPGYSDIVLGTNTVWLIYGHPSLVTLPMY